MTTTHSSYESYDRAYREHNWAASGILNEMIGAQTYLTDNPEHADAEAKARSWDYYLSRIQAWSTQAPELAP